MSAHVAAQLASQITPLRVGILPVEETDVARARAAAFARALGEATGLATELYRAADYEGLVGALERGDVSVGWVPPVVAARAVKRATIRPVAVAVRSGATGYSTALVTRADGPLKSLVDLDRATVAWVDGASAGGYLVIRAALRDAGADLDALFGSQRFLHSHAAVAQAVLAGEVDVGATYFGFHPGSTEIARASWKSLTPSSAIRVLAHAGPIPSDFLAVHHATTPEVFRTIQRALVGAPPSRRPRGAAERARSRLVDLGRSLFGADGFAEPTQAHLAMLRGLLSAVEVPSDGHPRVGSAPPAAPSGVPMVPVDAGRMPFDF